MADPLLTSLCSICHMSPPVYKCPRCSIATCSVPCVKKHKAWSQCSGERDATAYVPPSKLRTVAGVNHDYNFLHGMDLSRERTERVLVDDRQILQAEDLLPPLTKQTVKWKAGRDGKQRRVLVTRVVPRRTKKRRMERLLGKRLRQLNIDVVFAPTGMSRQRWNKTAFNRHTRRISWQVEWLVFDTENQITRRLSKALDNVPLYKAYHDMEPKRQRKPIWNEEVQRIASSAWTPGLDTLQEPGTGQWRVYCEAPILSQGPA
ncbi:hypothetical protein CDD82_3990 [Ophiocordyceps australis]|uniref:Box C/D snoRNA protein 1 n=1 Tax=Ophiocordyceps australis TaxID=1399860 RepID=A0A2C5Z9Q7_9HYPO|nr:hypothetical protein CDD82_3990 [Ophiocordyceps australis]